MRYPWHRSYQVLSFRLEFYRFEIFLHWRQNLKNLNKHYFTFFDLIKPSLFHRASVASSWKLAMEACNRFHAHLIFKRFNQLFSNFDIFLLFIFLLVNLVRPWAWAIWYSWFGRWSESAIPWAKYRWIVSFDVSFWLRFYSYVSTRSWLILTFGMQLSCLFRNETSYFSAIFLHNIGSRPYIFKAFIIEFIKSLSFASQVLILINFILILNFKIRKDVSVVISWGWIFIRSKQFLSEYNHLKTQVRRVDFSFIYSRMFYYILLVHHSPFISYLLSWFITCLPMVGILTSGCSSSTTFLTCSGAILWLTPLGCVSLWFILYVPGPMFALS